MNNNSLCNNFMQIASNWRYVLPPSRPAEHELQRIQLLLMDKDREVPVAILGSTIEYRDLLKEMGFSNIYIFDKNPEFYKITQSWCAYDCSREIFVEGNWLSTLKNFQNTFYVILSDLTMGNIPYEDREVFYESIYNALIQGGYFIDKVLTNELPLIPLKNIYDKYQKLPLNLKTANDFSCEALFCSELLNWGIINTTKFYEELTQAFSDAPKLLKIIEMSHLITPEKCVWFYGRPWKDLERIYIAKYLSSTTFNDIKSSPYYGRLKHFFNKKEIN